MCDSSSPRSDGPDPSKLRKLHTVLGAVSEMADAHGSWHGVSQTDVDDARAELAELQDAAGRYPRRSETYWLDLQAAVYRGSLTSEDREQLLAFVWETADLVGEGRIAGKPLRELADEMNQAGVLDTTSALEEHASALLAKLRYPLLSLEELNDLGEALATYDNRHGGSEQGSARVSRLERLLERLKEHAGTEGPALQKVPYARLYNVLRLVEAAGEVAQAIRREAESMDEGSRAKMILQYWRAIDSHLTDAAGEIEALLPDPEADDGAASVHIPAYASGDDPSPDPVHNHARPPRGFFRLSTDEFIDPRKVDAVWVEDGWVFVGVGRRVFRAGAFDGHHAALNELVTELEEARRDPVDQLPGILTHMVDRYQASLDGDDERADQRASWKGGP